MDWITQTSIKYKLNEYPATWIYDWNNTLIKIILKCKKMKAY